jgi:hypothetical protein
MVAFPNDSLSFYKILLRYELSCPPGGCDIYDRIATLKVIKHTGVIDSNLVMAPSYSVNGSSPDTLEYMNDTSYSYSYNLATQQIDSVALNAQTLLLFNDPQNPLTPTDTVQIWPTYFNQYTFNANGIATDSIAVPPDVTLYLTEDSTYVPFEVLEPYEIARAITPFGEGVVLWYDVSDYSTLLHDSVHLNSRVCGYDHGWHVTTDFYFIEGIPPMNPYKITNLWNGTWQYGNASDPIDNHLQPITLQIDPPSVYEKIKLTTTGHGWGGNPNPNVAEFSNLTHTLLVNGTALPNHLWRPDCGRNPLYPQGAPGYTSTWFYNRANWCPGSDAPPHNYNATNLIAGDSLRVDYNMLNYTVSGGPSGFYHPEYYIQSHLVSYDNIAYANNAAILEVKQPSDKFEFSRMNPVCDGYNPIVLIKNYGADTLTTLTFNYGIDGSYTNTFTWNGSLVITDTVSVLLPPVTFGGGVHTFDIYSSLPNGVADEFMHDDTSHKSFTATGVYNTNKIIIRIRTDNSPNETSWKVRDEAGTILFSRTGYPSSSTIFNDTVTLANGCYNVTIYDASGDGVCCYDGQGYARIIQGASTTPLLNNGDFGEFLSLNMTLDFQSGIDELSESNSINVYPNPANNYVKLNTGFESGELTVDLLDMMGRIISHPVKCNVVGYATEMNLPSVNDGFYYLRLQRKGVVMMKKVFIKQ